MKFVTQEERFNRAKAARVIDRPARPLHRRSRKVKFPDPLATYIRLKCNHLTTIEEIERYHAWQPKTNPKKYMCDICGKWVEQEPYKPPAEIPDIPLF